MQISLRRIVLALVALAFVAGVSRPLVAQGAPTQTAAGQPYTIEYYYKCQWGHQQEFLDLFLKNHWPLLKNGYELIANDRDGVMTMLAVADGTMSEPELAIWLRTYIRPCKAE